MVIGVEISIWMLWLHQKRTKDWYGTARPSRFISPKTSTHKIQACALYTRERNRTCEGAVLLHMHNCFSHKHRVVTSKLDPRPLTGSCSMLTGPEGGWWLPSCLCLQFDSWFQLQEHPGVRIPLRRPNCPLLEALINTNHINTPDWRSTHHSLVNEQLC